MKLRDYQEKAVDGTFAAWERAQSALIVLPTGCGKTVVFSEVIKRILSSTSNLQPPTSSVRRALVLAHREELVTQARDKLEAITGKEAAIEMAERRALPFLGVKPPIVVSTVQTQNSNGRMKRFDPSEFAAVIIDEAHHATSPSYRRVIDWFLKGNPSCRLLGVTATPDRKDKMALGNVFSVVASEYGLADAIGDGWLVPVRQQLVAVESLDFSHVKTTGGDLNQAELAEVMEQEENLQRIAAPTLEIVGSRRAIVFTASVKQAERLAEILNRGGNAEVADWICGETPKEDRRDKLARFKRGELKYMVNVGVLTEGFDDAGVDVVVMARPTKSRALYAQMAGRATRPASDIASRLGEGDAVARRQLIAASAKPSCLILDFVGNAGRHKLVTSADILGGKYDEEVIERAKKNMAVNNNPVEDPDGTDVSEALEKAKTEIEEEKKKIERDRRGVLARAKYATRSIDPFDRFDLVEASVEDPSMIISPTEEAQLMKFLKKEYERTSFARRQALVEEMRRRKRGRIATLGQARYLARYGFVSPLRQDEASRIIDRLSKKWR